MRGFRLRVVGQDDFCDFSKSRCPQNERVGFAVPYPVPKDCEPAWQLAHQNGS